MRAGPGGGRRSTARAAGAARAALLVSAVLLLAPAAPRAAAIAPAPAPAEIAAPRPELISSRPGNVRALLLTDCAKYQDWQTIAAAFAWRESGQPGSITRVANCNEKDRANYPQAMLDYVDTHMAPEVRPAHGGVRLARRGPGAGGAQQWLRHRGRGIMRSGMGV
jgi:hypothetical protein